MPRYGVMCFRASTSIFGPATAWLKGLDGNKKLWDSYEEADHEAVRLNAKAVSRNVFYEAEPFPWK